MLALVATNLSRGSISHKANLQPTVTQFRKPLLATIRQFALTGLIQRNYNSNQQT
jgi:hypothetical protein